MKLFEGPAILRSQVSKLRVLAIAAGLCLAWGTCLSNTAVAAGPPATMAVGNNLDGVVDWSTSWPFVDVFNRTRTWMTRNLDGSGAWDSGFGSLVPLDSNGWPTTVPFAVNGTNQLGAYHHHRTQ